MEICTYVYIYMCIYTYIYTHKQRHTVLLVKRVYSLPGDNVPCLKCYIYIYSYLWLFGVCGSDNGDQWWCTVEQSS